MKKILSLCLTFLILFHCFGVVCLAEEEKPVIDLSCPSAILIERSTGEVLYEKDSKTPRPLASVTKIMTLLLIVEAIDMKKISLEDMVSCSEHAVSMGGSQVYLKENETLSVHDMLKAIVVSSANDAAVAMAEYIAGSDEAFVNLMNEKAKALGMENTNFVNCTGLDADNHYSCAADIAIMSAELLKHDLIRDYTTIWMDTLRNGSFGLSNTNKLVRFYEGCTGLKTGSTSKALYCISASANRNGMELIAVVLAAPTSAKRFEDAKKLLNYGFAGFEIYNKKISYPSTIKVLGAKEETVPIVGKKDVSMLVKKGEADKIAVEIKLSDNITAPAQKNQEVGQVELILGEKIIGSYPLVLGESVEKATIWDIFLQILCVFLTV